jgi:protein ImuA
MIHEALTSCSLPPGLLPASELAHVSARAPKWRPGLDSSSHHSEVFAPGNEASGAAAALALAADALAVTIGADDHRPLMWVQDKAALRLGGRPYRAGLPKGFRHRLIHVIADKCEDALFALEEGLRCRDLAAVIGEVAGNPKALDFTASRRLTLTAEKHGVPLWLVRLDAARDLSSARLRWDVRSAPSPFPRWNPDAPGMPTWQAELFRARMHPPGTWILNDGGNALAARALADFGAQPAAAEAGAPHHVGMAFAAGDRSLAAW